MTVVKPNLGPHAQRANNPLSFDAAYAHVLADPRRIYYTTGNRTPFIVLATHVKKGKHANERVLRFMTNGKEKARS